MKYSIIYVDPPWRFEVYNRENGLGRSADQHYNTMTFDELAALPVGELAAKNSVLCMWVLDHMHDQAEALIKAWGFTKKTRLFGWTKTCPKGLKIKFGDLMTLISPHLGKSSFDEDIRIPPHLLSGWHMGTGLTGTRANPEDCWIATKGNGLPVLAKGINRAFVSPVEQHSKKPDKIRDLIVDLYGDLPRVELFARRPAPGWDVWGNEVESSPSAVTVLGEPERMVHYAKSS